MPRRTQGPPISHFTGLRGGEVQVFFRAPRWHFCGERALLLVGSAPRGEFLKYTSPPTFCCCCFVFVFLITHILRRLLLWLGHCFLKISTRKVSLVVLRWPGYVGNLLPPVLLRGLVYFLTWVCVGGAETGARTPCPLSVPVL